MTVKVRWLLLTLPVMACVAMLLFWRTLIAPAWSPPAPDGGHPASPGAESPSSVEGSFPVVQAKPGDVVPGSRPDAAVAALPPPGEPLASTFVALKRLAERGNDAASCRLAVELQACVNASRMLEHASMLSHLPGQAGNADQVLKGSERFASLCDGVSADMLAQAYHFQRVAAAGGDPDRLRWLILRPELDRLNFLGQLPEWADYRQRAEAYLRSAFEQQRGEDLEMLLLIHAPQHLLVPAPPYRIRDSVTFLALLDVSRARGISISPEMETAARNLEQGLTAIERQRLAARIDRYRQGFAGAPTDGLGRLLIPSTDKDFCN